MTHMSPARFRLLMCRHGWTIRTLAIAGGVNQDRIRELRAEGIYVGKLEAAERRADHLGES